MTATPEPLWTPPPELLAGCAMARYRDDLAAAGVPVGAGYDGLWRWSVDQLEDFWASIVERFEVVHSAPARAVLTTHQMPGAEWFPGMELNFAGHLLAQGQDDAPAILHATERQPLATITWAELRATVAAVAAGLRELGVQPGDRVVSCLPNIPEAVIAFLAAASIGAVWSSCSPDFGARSIADRFAQIGPVVLFCGDGYDYGGKRFDRTEQVAELRAALPSLRATIVVSDGTGGQIVPDALTWGELCDRGAGAELVFEQLPFSAPLWVLYSSGTTGLPKAIVQSHGGILLEQVKLHHLHLDLGPSDRLFWLTTTGWMMWNFLAGALVTGAAIVLYDGSPGYPDMGAVWELVAEAQVTVMGAGAAYVAACMKAAVRPADGRDLSRLKALGVTGSPLSPEGFDWVYDELGKDIWLFSTSGGTDVCTAFVGGVPLLPVYRGELQGRALGCAIESWDDDGRPLIGEVGELVITEPMPSMPIGFWGDDDGSRYRESYFEHYPGVWRHGDWIEITERGSAIIYGRSDSTINRGGIRMGTSEIYRAVLAVDAVLDALVVDVPREGTQGWMSLFVVLREGVVLDDDLRRRIGAEIRRVCSARHVPDEIVEVTVIPRTLSGKVMEVPVKRILMGMDPARAASRDSMADPAALDPFIALAAERPAG